MLPELTVSGDFRVGPRTYSTTPTPKRLYLGNDIPSGTPGTAGNLKLQLAEGSGFEWGIGLSSNLMEYQAPTGAGEHAFYAGGTQLFRVGSSGASVVPQISLGNTLWRAGSNFAYADAAAATLHRVALFATLPAYADDAAAAADGALPSKAAYLITGSTVLHIKP